LDGDLCFDLPTMGAAELTRAVVAHEARAVAALGEALVRLRVLDEAVARLVGRGEARVERRGVDDDDARGRGLLGGLLGGGLLSGRRLSGRRLRGRGKVERGRGGQGVGKRSGSP
jgi:hypothetical protein